MSVLGSEEQGMILYDSYNFIALENVEVQTGL